MENTRVVYLEILGAGDGDGDGEVPMIYRYRR
jgi:hypothetical protein